MIEIQYRFKPHYFYTVDEAREKNIQYLNNWRDGKVGDWVLSDNGYVCNVLNRYEWNEKCRKGPSIALVFANGTYSANWKKTKFIASKEKRTNLSGKTIKRGSRLDKRVDLLLDLAIKTGFNWDAAFKFAFADGRHKVNLKKVLAKILNSDIYKRKFMDKLDEKLDEHSLGIDELLKHLKGFLDDKNEKTAGVSFEALKCAFRLRGIDITKTNTNGNHKLSSTNNLKEITEEENANFKELPKDTEEYINTGGNGH